MFYDAGLRADLYPSMSVSITETEIAVIGTQYLLGHYAAWNYFQSTKDLPFVEGGFDPTVSRDFVQKYRDRHGADKLVTDPMESAYIGVHLWAQAVALAGTFDLEPVRRSLLGQAFPAPQGEVVMQANHHISKVVRLGQVEMNGDFKIIYSGSQAVRPVPWNQLVSSTRGYACDWSDAAKGGFYKLRTMDVALVHALNGPRERLERRQLEAELVAISDINSEGGILGSMLQAVVMDTGSDDAAALAHMTAVAMNASGPVVILGNVPSDAAYEGAVKDTRTPGAGPPLLLSPSAAAGGQSGEHVLHMGGVANQLFEAVISYFLGRSESGTEQFFIVGPGAWRTSGAMDSLAAKITAAGGTASGSLAFVPDGPVPAASSADISAVVSSITTAMSRGIIINVLESLADNLALFQELSNQGVSAGVFPVVSTGISEADVEMFALPDGRSLLQNQFMAVPYVSGVDTPGNVAFLSSMAETYGLSYPVVNTMESAYSALRYWAFAAQAAGSVDSKEVLRAMWASPYSAPSGQIQLKASNYVSKQSRLAMLDARGRGFRVVAGGSEPLDPKPLWLDDSAAGQPGVDYSWWLSLLCPSGQGLTAASGTFLASTEGAASCGWCAPGSESLMYTEPWLLPTRVCAPCPLGQHQPSLGATACLQCEPGTIAASPGATSCSPCAVGRYLEVPGGSSCTQCPPPMVTRGVGSVSSEACICPAGKYKVTGEMSCMDCPTGILCPMGTDQQEVSGAASWTYSGEIKVGILHSLTGTMAISEQTVVNAELMAIGEINAAGGLLGKKIVPVIEDGESDWDVFAAKAQQFTDRASPDFVEVVFGCWTSASRKSVLPVFEANDHMLFYPVQYEGQECSKNVFYTGAAPNQQIEPAVDWLLRHKGKEFFLVGSDYVFPRTANDIIKGQLAALGGKVVGERYLPLGESRNETVGAIIEEIRSSLPSSGIIFNTLNGDSNVKFFHMLFDAGLRAETHPVMSVSITETEIAAVGVEYLAGHFAAWNYFMSTMDLPKIEGGFDPAESRKFVGNYQQLYGEDSLVNDPMEAAYIAVKLWAQAVALAGTFDIPTVREALVGQAYAAPEGEVVMQSNHHITKFVRLGRVQADGKFDLVYQSSRSVFPEPWNFWIDSTRGHGCDWSNDERGGFYKLDAVNVVLLHSVTGARSDVEKTYLEAEMAAIKAINRNGGVLGKAIVPLIYDGASDDAVVKDTIRQIVSDPMQTAQVFFGSAPSDADYDRAAAATVNPNGPPLLMDPRRLFGGECSRYVVHTGGLTNQQLQPAMEYFSSRARSGGLGTLSFYAVGPEVLHPGGFDFLRQHIEGAGDRLAGSSVITSSAEAALVAEAIDAAMPSGGVVLVLLEHAILARDVAASIKARKLAPGTFPVLFTGIAESDVALFGDLLANQYVALPYFSSLASPQSVIFADLMHEFYGYSYTVSDRTEAAYVAVQAWVAAVEAAGSFAGQEVLHKMWSTQIAAPTGAVQVMGTNFLSKQCRIGTLNAQGTGFRVVQDLAAAVEPLPYWLQAEEAHGGATCDFAISLRTICSNGMGLVNASAGGFIGTWDGAVGCDWCPPGTHSVPYEEHARAPTRICTACPVGTMQNSPGQDSCRPCDRGSYQDEPGTIACMRCAVGSFANETGQSSCRACGSLLTTPFLGADTVELCICQEGYFSRAGAPCEPCLQGMLCDVGSDTRYFPGGAARCEGGLPCKFPVVKAGFMTLQEDPLDVWACQDSARCPGGDPGMCAPRLQGRACQLPEPGWSWNGKVSSRCTELESGAFLFPVLPILLGPIVVAMLYKTSGDTYERWGSWRNGLASMAFVLVNHYQMLAIVRSCAIEAPSRLANLFRSFAFTSDVSIVFKPDCAGFSSFGKGLVLKCLAPLLVCGIYFVTWLGSQGVQRVLERLRAPIGNLAMERNRTINGFFSVIFLFFAGITELTLTTFKCGQSPNGKSTLIADRSLVCGESDWNGYAVLGAAAFLVWVVGFGGMFARTVWLMPKWFMKSEPRARWKFLFIKFRPDVHFWSLVILSKSVLLNFGFICLSTGVGQVYWMIVVMICYVCMLSAFRPWRHLLLNAVDTVSHMLMLLVCSLLSWFARDTLEDAKTVDSDIVTLAAFCCFLCIGLSLPLGAYMIRRQMTAAARLGKEASDFKEVLALAKSVPEKDFERFMANLSEYDMFLCSQVSRILLVELKGTKSAIRLCSGLGVSNSFDEAEASAAKATVWI
eukprot:SRR837773.1220.p1 GENE.SRR837773.1220~~SRR837773.1220.p1  ORF type:complete len:2447 (+),score=839.26 SRR837773.1220:691-7341(+)